MHLQLSTLRSFHILAPKYQNGDSKLGKFLKIDKFINEDLNSLIEYLFNGTSELKEN